MWSLTGHSLVPYRTTFWQLSKDQLQTKVWSSKGELNTDWLSERMTKDVGTQRGTKPEGQIPVQRGSFSKNGTWDSAVPKGIKSGSVPNSIHCMVAEHGSEPRLWAGGSEEEERKLKRLVAKTRRRCYGEIERVEEQLRRVKERRRGTQEKARHHEERRQGRSQEEECLEVEPRMAEILKRLATVERKLQQQGEEDEQRIARPPGLAPPNSTGDKKKEEGTGKEEENTV